LTRIESKLELQSKDYSYTNKRMDDTIESVKENRTEIQYIKNKVIDALTVATT